MTLSDEFRRAEKANAARYNRRTRAMERQACALERLAESAETRNLIETAGMSPVTTAGSGSRSWKTEHAQKLMKAITARLTARGLIS